MRWMSMMSVPTERGSLLGPEVHFAYGRREVPALCDDLNRLAAPRPGRDGEQVDLHVLPLIGGDAHAVEHGMAVGVVQEEAAVPGHLSAAGVAVVDAQHERVLGALPAATRKAVREHAEVRREHELLVVPEVDVDLLGEECLTMSSALATERHGAR